MSSEPERESSATTAPAIQDFELADCPANLALLVAQSDIQDSLLQSYRQILLAIQSILLAIGAGLTVTFLSKGELRIIGAVVLVLAIISYVAGEWSYEICRQRAGTVSFVHRRIMLTEQQLPSNERTLTLLKLYQQRRDPAERLSVLLLQDVGAVPPEIIRQGVADVVSAGFSHTRIRLDKLILWTFRVTWIALVLVTIIELF